MHFKATKPRSSTNTDHWETHSKNNDLPYHIFVSKPQGEAPEEGYPVIYVLDGNAFFQPVQDMVRLQSRRSDKTGVLPAITVGIGYPSDTDFVMDRRFKDLTPPSQEGAEPLTKPDGKPWPEHGGGDLFHQFIVEELQPFIQEQYPVNAEKQILFGHSLGGLYTLYTLFQNPDAFQGYIATSPSIWWDEKEVLAYRAGFVENLGNYSSVKRLFMTVGSDERGHMVADARQLSQELSTVSHEQFQMDYREAEGENHLSVVPTTLSRALRFVNDAI